MIFTKEEYQEYMGESIPPLRYYDMAVGILKDYCNEFDDECVGDLNPKELEKVKKAVMLQMDYTYNNLESVQGLDTSISIGKFTSGRTGTNNVTDVKRGHLEAIKMLHDVYGSNLWVR